MHVIVEQDTKLVEIQVRTAIQNRWAQVFERLGDLERFFEKRLLDAASMIEALRDLQEMVPAAMDAESMVHDAGSPTTGAVHYLVGYKRRTGRLVVAHPCADPAEVLTRRGVLEEQHRGDDDFEIVLLSSQSKADLSGHMLATSKG